MKKLFWLVILFLTLNCNAANFSAGFQGTYSSTTTSTMALDGVFNRNYLLIVNTGTDTVMVKIGSVHTGTEGIPIGPNGSWEPVTSPRESIWVKSISGTNDLFILEGRMP